eukprot:9503513-Prorocentrum_lima.AAC.1
MNPVSLINQHSQHHPQTQCMINGQTQAPRFKRDALERKQNNSTHPKQVDKPRHKLVPQRRLR